LRVVESKLFVMKLFTKKASIFFIFKVETTHLYETSYYFGHFPRLFLVKMNFWSQSVFKLHSWLS